VPVKLGKDPVAPAKLPVPPVMVADPLSVPVSAAAGILIVPVMVPVVPVVNVIVNVPFKFCEPSGVMGSVPLKVPLPIPLRLAVPLALRPVAPMLPVVVTLNVVFVVAACKPAHTSSAGKMVTNLRVMVCQFLQYGLRRIQR
jgi:hypothetical protein